MLMSKLKVEIAHAFDAAVTATLETAGKVTPDKRLRQPRPGKAHPLWLLGHLTVVTDTYLNGMALGMKPELEHLFARFAPSFAGGSPVSADGGEYPPWEELLGHYERCGRAGAAGIRKLDDGELGGKGKGDIPAEFDSYFAVLGRTLLALTEHDGYHRGQMGLLAALD
jgi:hypothetical protein